MRQQDSTGHDVLVVGGGTVGLAIGWRAAARGLRPLVLDAGEPGAWQVAAGMLAPVAEADFGEDEVVALGVRSMAAFPAFCAQLAEASGVDPSLRGEGTLVVARDADEAAVLDRLHALHGQLGLFSERLLPSRARRREPALAPTVRLALDVPGDRSIDPRRLAHALGRAVREAGGTVRTAAPVARLLRADGLTAGAAVGVELRDGERITAERVVLAAGAAVSRIGGLTDPERVPVRPLKGQILRLRDPAGPGLVQRTVRAPTAYLVPRGDGRYVLGATMEERGWNTSPTAGGAFELIRDMSEVVPGVLELEIEELAAGLRPSTPDNRPAIGAGAVDGLLWATGHHRNGILLTPITAELIAGALAGDPPGEDTAAFSPLRFSASAGRHDVGPMDAAPTRTPQEATR